MIPCGLIIVLCLLVSGLEINGDTCTDTTLKTCRNLTVFIEKSIEELMGNKTNELLIKTEDTVNKISNSPVVQHSLSQLNDILKAESFELEDITITLREEMNNSAKMSRQKITNVLKQQHVNFSRELHLSLSSVQTSIQTKIDTQLQNLWESVDNAKKSANGIIQTKLSKVSRQNSDTQTVAFSAVLTNNIDTRATFVRFDREIINVGKGYDHTNGTFTAPLNGLYLFTFAFLAANGDLNIQLVKNDHEVGRVYATQKTHENTGLLSVNLYLNAGDQVGLKINPDRSTGILRGDLYSTFSGIML